jgi:hypothetical protein
VKKRKNKKLEVKKVIVLMDIDKDICKDCPLQEECKKEFENEYTVVFYYPKENNCLTVHDEDLEKLKVKIKEAVSDEAGGE